ncbi:ABC transporter ATP-binding protein [Staphylococcus caeli]|uniref:ABC transporter ATP-binding protein n=1 Tax=Staphylococcus caeli TaxID=2201815 RepID=UPI003F57977A
MEYIIEMKNVTKHFKNKIAVNDMNFTVKKGEIFGFLGPSGSGKTTTIKMLTGTYKPSKGSLNVLDFKGTTIGSKNFMSKVGILSDHSTVYERQTIEDNLNLFAKLNHIATEKVTEVLKFVDLTNDRKTVYKKLSAGMKQRVLLAKALLHEPDLLFLDEPTASLDPATIQHIHKGLKALNKKGTTIFLTTHNMQEANDLCDRVAIIDSGILKALDTPENFRFKYSNHTLRVIHNNNLEKTLPMTAESAQYITNMLETNDLKYIASDLPTLGDVFLKITGKELI